MSDIYIQSFLPSWVKLIDFGNTEITDVSFQFQLEWEKKFSEMWYSLTDSERKKITPIEPPYTEKSVVEFLEILKQTKENRGIIDSITSVLPDFTKDKPLPIAAMKEVKILEQVENGTHLVLFSWMKTIEYQEKCFAIGQYQVTQAIWERVMGNNPSYQKGSTHPVENVSWFDCITFCNILSTQDGLEKVYTIPDDLKQALSAKKNWHWRDEKLGELSRSISQNLEVNGYRLPTEEEWKYAAKANQEFAYAGSNTNWKVAWTDGNSKSTHSVGELLPNGFGLYDMSGNVWEWCADADNASATQRAVRGCGYRTRSQNSGISKRYSHTPTSKNTDIGIRLCRTIR